MSFAPQGNFFPRGRGFSGGLRGSPNFGPPWGKGISMGPRSMFPRTPFYGPPIASPGLLETPPRYCGSVPQLDVSGVLGWLNDQPHFVIKSVFDHCHYLLGLGDVHDAEGEKLVIPDDTSDWYESGPPLIMGDYIPQRAMLGHCEPRPPFMAHPQWRHRFQKDSQYKVTSVSKPLASPSIIPEQCSLHPEADADRIKLNQLENNAKMMSQELVSICRKYQIVKFDKENISQYPEEHQPRLRVAVQCVSAAESTLKGYKDFLRDEKYKAWNEEQKRQREENIKALIGETPSGTPHPKRTKVEDNSSLQTNT